MQDHEVAANATELQERDLLDSDAMWKLLDWIDESKLNWRYLSFNPRAMYMLKKNMHKICLLYTSDACRRRG